MELWLTVETEDELRHELAVAVAESTTVGELVEAIAGALDLPAGSYQVVGLPRLGKVLDRSALALEAGLRFGDRLTLTRRALPQERARRGRTGVTRRVASVVGGPGTGTRLALSDGEYLIGRSGDCDLAVDDPALSWRHARLIVDGDSVTVSDEGSSNGTFIDGHAVVGPTALAEGAVVELGHTLVKVDAYSQRRNDAAAAVSGLVPFNRPPRVVEPQKSPKLTIAAPPAPRTKSRLPMTSALGPLLLGIPMVALGSGAMRTIGLVSMLLSPLIAVLSFVEDRRSGRRDHRMAVSQWRSALSDLDSSLEAALQHETLDRRRRSPDAAELLDRAATARPGLWERRPSDRDFLQLSIGWSDQRSFASVALGDGGDAELRSEVEAVIERRSMVTNVPVLVNLLELGTVGLAGEASATSSLLRWIAAQVVTLHSPRDVAVVAIVAPTEAEQWHWLTWTPHLRGATSPVGGHRFATTSEQAAELLTELRSLTRSDDAVWGKKPSADASGPHLILFVSRAAPVARNTVAELLGASAGRLSVVWQEDDVDALPGAATCIVHVHGLPAVADVTWAATGDRLSSCLVDQLSVDAVEALAVDLAPIRDVTAGGARGQIPRTATLPDTTDVSFPLGGWLASRWRASTATRSTDLDAVIGVSASGPFTVDIRRDGPHALVGGTTGAGKSELLQALISGLVVNHPPDKVTFLLVDYKGGAAFKDAVHLPHTVGLVTDLDGHLVNRALTSLHAELRRREHLLRDHGMRDLIEMERKLPHLAPPSLILIVDEFATLAKELPEFVDGVVSVAQRGRSLGIHLVLATQRPAGAINDNIRANTNLRIALRMNDIADSNDVVDSPDAASLPRTLPGRAYVKTGQAEMNEVQISYVGGHALSAAQNDEAASSTAVLSVVGRASSAASPVDDDRPTDLQLLVAAAKDAVEILGLPPQPAPWVPPLSECIPLASVEAEALGRSAVIGVVDLPDQQRQIPHVVDLDQVGSLVVYGTGGSGKSTLLRTMAVSLALRNGVDDVWIYGIDAAGRGLGPLTALPHVGDVVGGDEVDRVQRLIRMVEAQIRSRQHSFAEVGASNLIEFRRRFDQVMPHIVVMLDGYASFVSVFERIEHGAWLDRLTTLATEGRAVGIHLVITADRRATVPSALAAAMSDLIALRLSDDDHGALGLDPNATKGVHFVPGRGFTGASRELQIAVVGPDGAGDAQLDAITALGAEFDAARGAPEIGRLPTVVHALELPVASGKLALGIGDRDLQPVYVDPLDGGFLIAGPNRSGRSSALALLAAGTPPLASGGIYLFAPRRSPLTDLDLWTRVARGHAQCDEFAEELCDELIDRAIDDPLVAVFIDDAGELSDSDAEAPLEKLARRARDLNVWFCVAGETTQVRRSFGGPLSEVRRDRHGLLLRPDPDLDGDLLDAQVPRLAPAAWVPGRGLLVVHAVSEVVQVGL